MAGPGARREGPDPAEGPQATLRTVAEAACRGRRPGRAVRTGHRGGGRRSGAGDHRDRHRPAAHLRGPAAVGVDDRAARCRRLLSHGPRRGRRDRGVRLGGDAVAHVHPLGRTARVQRGDHRSHGGGGRGQVGYRGGDRRLRLRLHARRERHTPAGADLSVRRQQAAPYVVRVGGRIAGHRRLHRCGHPAGRSARGHLPLQRGPAASMSTRPTVRSA